jgi:hypothetical protein
MEMEVFSSLLLLCGKNEPLSSAIDKLPARELGPYGEISGDPVNR